MTKRKNKNTARRANSKTGGSTAIQLYQSMPANGSTPFVKRSFSAYYPFQGTIGIGGVSIFLDLSAFLASQADFGNMAGLYRDVRVNKVHLSLVSEQVYSTVYGESLFYGYNPGVYTNPTNPTQVLDLEGSIHTNTVAADPPGLRIVPRYDAGATGPTRASPIAAMANLFGSLTAYALPFGANSGVILGTFRITYETTWSYLN